MLDNHSRHFLYDFNTKWLGARARFLVKIVPNRLPFCYSSITYVE